VPRVAPIFFLILILIFKLFMPRVMSVLCYVSSQYDDMCQVIIWISIWSTYLLFWFHFSLFL